MRQKAFKEIMMQKLILSLAALAVLGVALPYAAPAKADPVVIVRHHHDWHPYWHHHDHDHTVIIKHHDY